MPIDYNIIKKIFIDELENILDNELFYLDLLNDNKKQKLKNIIVKEIRNRISSNNIIERSIHKDYCIHKYVKGKKQGEYCCKKITINGDKNKFVCTKHNKSHIPKNKCYKKINGSDNPNPDKILKFEKNIRNKYNSNKNQHIFTIKNKNNVKNMINILKIKNKYI